MERLVSTLSSFPDIHITKIGNEAWALIKCHQLLICIQRKCYTCTQTLHEYHEPMSRLKSSCILITCGAGQGC